MKGKADFETHPMVKFFEKLDYFQKHPHLLSTEVYHVLQNFQIDYEKILNSQKIWYKQTKITSILDDISYPKYFDAKFIRDSHLSFRTLSEIPDFIGAAVICESLGLLITSRDNFLPDIVEDLLSLFHKILDPIGRDATLYICPYIAMAVIDYKLLTQNICQLILISLLNRSQYTEDSTIEITCVKRIVTFLLQNKNPTPQIFELLTNLVDSSLGSYLKFEQDDMKNAIMAHVLMFDVYALKFFLKIANKLPNDLTVTAAQNVFEYLKNKRTSNASDFQDINIPIEKIDNFPCEIPGTQELEPSSDNKPSIILKSEIRDLSTNLNLFQSKLVGEKLSDIRGITSALLFSNPNTINLFLETIANCILSTDDNLFELIAISIKILRQIPDYCSLFQSVFFNAEIFNPRQTIFGPDIINPILSSLRSNVLNMMAENTQNNLITILFQKYANFPFFIADIAARLNMFTIRNMFVFTNVCLEIIINSLIKILKLFNDFPKESLDAISSIIIFISTFIEKSNSWAASQAFIKKYFFLLTDSMLQEVILAQLQELLNNSTFTFELPLSGLLTKLLEEDTVKNNNLIRRILLISCSSTNYNSNVYEIVKSLLDYFLEYLNRFPSHDILMVILNFLEVKVATSPEFFMSNKQKQILFNVIKKLEPNGINTETMDQLFALTQGSSYCPKPYSALKLLRPKFIIFLFICYAFEPDFWKILDILNQCILATPSNAESILRGYIPHCLLKFLSQEKEECQISTKSDHVFTIFIPDEHRDIAYNLFFNILILSSHTETNFQLISELYTYLAQGYTPKSKVLLKKFIDVISAQICSPLPQFVVGSEPIFSVRGNFTGILQRDFAITFWLKVDQKLLLANNPPIELFKIVDNNNSIFCLQINHNQIEVYFQDATRRSKVVLLSDPFKVCQWMHFAFSYNYEDQKFTNYFDSDNVKLSEFSRPNLGEISQINIGHTDMHYAELNFCFIGPFSFYGHQISQEFANKLAARETIGDPIFTSFYMRRMEQMNFTNGLVMYPSMKNYHMPLIEKLSAPSLKIILMSVFSKNTDHEYNLHILNLFEILTHRDFLFNDFNTEFYIIRTIRENMDEKLRTYSCFKLIKSIAMRSFSPAWMNELVLNPWMWLKSPDFKRIVKEWSGNIVGYNNVYPIALSTLSVDYYLLMTNNLLEKDVQEMLELTIKRLSIMKCTSKHAQLIIGLLKHDLSDELKIVLVRSLTPINVEKIVVLEFWKLLEFNSPIVNTEIVMMFIRMAQNFHLVSLGLVKKLRNMSNSIFDILFDLVPKIPDLFPFMLGLTLKYDDSDRRNKLCTLDPQKLSSGGPWFIFPVASLFMPGANVQSILMWISMNVQNESLDSITAIFVLFILLSSRTNQEIMSTFIEFLVSIILEGKITDENIIDRICFLTICSMMFRFENGASIGGKSTSLVKSHKELFSYVENSDTLASLILNNIDTIFDLPSRVLEKLPVYYDVLLNDKKKGLLLEERVFLANRILEKSKQERFILIEILSGFKKGRGVKNLADFKAQEKAINDAKIEFQMIVNAALHWINSKISIVKKDLAENIDTFMNQDFRVASDMIRERKEMMP